MLRNYFLLNLLLILVIGLLGLKLYGILAHTEEIPSKASVRETDPKEKVSRGGRDSFNERNYENIVQMDLFRPSRTAPAVEEKKKTETVVSQDAPKLFGTIILDDNKTAILEDPATRTTKVYRIDDTISGYRLTEILEDKVVLLANGDTVEVKLREDKGIKPVRKPAVAPAARTQVENRRSAQRRSRPVPPRRRPTRVRPRADNPGGPPVSPGDPGQ